MGMISETKTLHLGVKNWDIDLKLCTLVDDYCCRQTAWYPNFLRHFLSLDGKPRSFGSEHFSTCPNFYYLDILLSLKYLRHFPLTRNVKENLDPEGG